MRGPLRLSLAAAALAGAALPASAAAQGDGGLQRAFSYGGSECVEPIASLTVPVERVRPYVPDPYVPVGTGAEGTADVALNVASCGRLTLDGRTVAGRVVVDVGVAIASPDGSDGAHMLQLTHVNDDGDLAAAMADAGVPGGRVDGLAVRQTGPGAATSAVPAGPDPFSVEVTNAFVPVASAPAVTWWAPGGSRGLVRLRYRFGATQVDQGAARVTVPAGGRLAQLLGGTQVTGRGYLARLGFEGVVDTERSASAGPPAGEPAVADENEPPPRLSVAPGQVRAGRRVGIVVRVRPARAGVLVRLGGRRARTDARGVARLTVRLRRGTHRVSAAGARGATVRAR